MRVVRIAIFASLAACISSAAWAQYGLYGSPDTLPMPQSNAVAATAPASYPSTATPSADPMPATASAYQPYQPSPYRYPAQSAAAAMYQPYQPGAQYRYPGPAVTRPPVRTASVDPSMQTKPAADASSPYAAPTEPAMPDTQASAGTPSTNVMNQVLADQPCNGCAGANGCGPYRGAMSQFEQSACGANGNACGLDGCDQADFCRWYASAEVLVMSRSDGRRFWTSYDDSDERIQLGNSQIPLEWKWGGKVSLGRRFCCGCVPYAIEATYWTTDAFSGSQLTEVSGGLVSTPLNLNYLTFNGASAEDWFFGAQHQVVTRSDELHNVEINLIREPLAWACNSPWDVGFSVGVRYFRFQDQLTFASLANDSVSDAYFSERGRQRPDRRPGWLRRSVQPHPRTPGVYRAQVWYLRQFHHEQLQRPGQSRHGTVCRRRRTIRQLPGARHRNRSLVPHADRRGYRLADHAELERTGRLPRCGRHRHGPRRRSIPAVHGRSAGDLRRPTCQQPNRARGVHRRNVQLLGASGRGQGAAGDCPDFRVSENGTVPFAAVCVATAPRDTRIRTVPAVVEVPTGALPPSRP